MARFRFEISKDWDGMITIRDQTGLYPDRHWAGGSFAEALAALTTFMEAQ